MRGIERDEVIVGRFHEQPVAAHAEAAIADVGAALGLPEVVPELAAVARVHRPGVVGRGEVENAVDRENGRADVRTAAAARIRCAFAADDRRGAAAPKRRHRVRAAATAAGGDLAVQARVRFLTLD